VAPAHAAFHFPSSIEIPQENCRVHEVVDAIPPKLDELFRTKNQDRLVFWEYPELNSKDYFDSDLLLQSPLSVLGHLGAEWSMEFGIQNLSWPSGYAPDWHLKNYYQAVAESTGLQPGSGEVLRLSDGTPKYLEVESEVTRLKLQQLYRDHYSYYEKLLNYAVGSN
jgi:hypothetical protein